MQFVEGDAGNLPNLGQFGCVFIGNALHHLPNPKAFLDQVPDIIVPGGILVIADFYIWTEEHLPKVGWCRYNLGKLNDPHISELNCDFSLLVGECRTLWG